MPAEKGNQYWKLRESQGRPPKYSDPDELWAKCCDYFEWVEANPIIEKQVLNSKSGPVSVEVPKHRPMTKAGLCIHLGIGQSTLDEMQKREDLLAVITRAREVIYVQKFEGAAIGVFNANLIARELGLRDHQKVEQTVNPYADMSEEELDARLAELRKRHEERRGADGGA
ncbi:DNA-packaging protein [Pelagicoccus enzymogenes]|uniref:DNA-packaging protein n=1 Tax=Pelagicoccus enzymogenes TaxID=2773457 RepID=UPI00280F7B8D|nr:DNA-packaging protein [Pelagicoccus enzymogenes]MDQ8200689.1 DNA-packaging protein [Pelagicoccus enzymogenes]